eukprot:1383553-Karenia_brevis.AAC.1
MKLVVKETGHLLGGLFPVASGDANLCMVLSSLSLLNPAHSLCRHWALRNTRDRQICLQLMAGTCHRCCTE